MQMKQEIEQLNEDKVQDHEQSTYYGKNLNKSSGWRSNKIW